MKINKFENNDYETVTLPYGPKYDAKRIMKLLYTKVYTVYKKILFYLFLSLNLINISFSINFRIWY